MAAVKFDVAHIIMVCWVLSLQKLGAEHIGHPGWPTNMVVKLALRLNPYQFFFRAFLPATK